METFNRRENIEEKLQARNVSLIENCRGFSLIELLVAASTVAVLVALLLPAIQKKREDNAAKWATQNITAMMAASNEYHTRMGTYPNSISQLYQFCGSNPGSCSLDPQLATGRAGGYNVIMANTEGDFHIEAEPEIPGITGSLTLTINHNGVLTSTPTPGSDDARKRAFDNIVKSGAGTVAALLAMDSTGDATAQIRSYTGGTTISAGTLNSVFSALDTNHDAKVSVSEVNGFLTGDPNGPTYVPEKTFFDTVSRELRLDLLSVQDVQNTSAAMTDLDTTQPSLFSYDGLRNLTIVMTSGSGADTSDVLAKLDAAEAAEASGNSKAKAKAIKQYRKMIKSHIGGALTRANANTLIAISDTL